MDDARREALERWDMAREEYLYPYDRAGRMRNAGNELARLLREDAATYEAVRTTVDAAPLAAAEQFVALCTRHDEDAVAVRLVCELRAALLAVLVAAGRGEGEGPQPKEVMPHADGDSAAAPVSVAPSPAPAVPSLADDPKAVEAGCAAYWQIAGVTARPVPMVDFVTTVLRAAESARSTGEAPDA